MPHSRCNASGLCAALAAAVTLTGPLRSARAGTIDQFVINLEQTVSNGTPGAGAGNLEVSGAMDVYTFTVAPNTLVYFDELSGPCNIQWTCEAPDSTLLFNNNAICVTDAGTFNLAGGGTYAITVYSNSGATGTYSFILWQVNPVEVFPIDLKQTVSNGIPGPGAGNLEEPGAIDQYTFTADAGMTVYFDELGGSCAILWKCQAPGGALLFNDNPICVGDPGSIVLPSTGEYTISVYSGNSGITGMYSFKLWGVEPPQVFAINLEQTISNGVPAAGAGNLEEPGSIDQYTFQVDPGTLVYFDELGGGCGIVWKCQAPDSTLLFNNNPICVGDPGEFLLDQSGTYTVTVYSSGGAIGTYSFRLLQVNPIETFAISLEQTVSNGVPGAGAGNIEEPGAIDEYTFTVAPNTLVFFDELGSASCGLQWKCSAPDNSVVFANNAMCINDPGVILLTQGGEYTIQASGISGGTGTYSFIIWEVNPPELFDIAIDEVVSDGVPGAGAGHIEEPGAIDQYTLNAQAGDIICFEELGGPCNLTWTCKDPNGVTMFTDTIFCNNSNPGKFILTASGDYTISVSGQGDTVGAYSCVVNTGRVADITGDCHVNVADLLAVINSWGPCPAPPDACEADIAPLGGGDSVVNNADLLMVINDWS